MLYWISSPRISSLLGAVAFPIGYLGSCPDGSRAQDRQRAGVARGGGTLCALGIVMAI